MSLEAFIWVSRLPVDACGPKPFRVLLLLADHAHRDGRNVWRKNSEIAGELGCSVRTVERAITELKMVGLIREGDQRLVQHLRGDRRPKVYDLNFEYGKSYDAPTTLVGAYDPTDLSRPDETGRHGPTTVVAHRTVKEPSVKTSQRNHTPHVGSSGLPCDGELVADHYCVFGHIVAPDSRLANA